MGRVEELVTGDPKSHPKLFEFHDLIFTYQIGRGERSATGRMDSGRKRAQRVRRGESKRADPGIIEGQKFRDEGRVHFADPPPVLPAGGKNRPGEDRACDISENCRSREISDCSDVACSEHPRPRTRDRVLPRYRRPSSLPFRGGPRSCVGRYGCRLLLKDDSLTSGALCRVQEADLIAVEFFDQVVEIVIADAVIEDGREEFPVIHVRLGGRKAVDSASRSASRCLRASRNA